MSCQTPIQTPNTKRPLRLLAVASGGGHWVQMLRLRPAFDGADLHFATVDASAATMVAPAPVHIYPDANKDAPLRLIRMALRLGVIVLRVRPDVVVSTGAAGGLLAILFARAMGARTMFIDSIANAERLSLSARLSRHVAHRVLSQWPTVAAASRTEFCGAVI